MQPDIDHFFIMLAEMRYNVIDRSVSKGITCEIVRMKVSDSIMEADPGSPSTQQITFTLEVASDDLSDADPALVDAVGRDTADTLRSDGYRNLSVGK